MVFTTLIEAILQSKLAIIVTSLVVGFLGMVLGSALFTRVNIRRAVSRIRHHSYGKAIAGHFHKSTLEFAPPVVARFLRQAVPDGHQMITHAHVEQNGVFRTQIDGQWSTFRAGAHYSTIDPGMVWHASFGRGLFPRKTANLEYFHGHGHGIVRLFGLFTVLEPTGIEADISLLSRFLMEAVWFPTALAPGGKVRWEPISEYQARAVISSHGMQASALFTFNADGDVDHVVTQDKYRDFKGSFEKENFSMYCRNYKSFEGIRVPTELEFVWNLGTGDFSYGRFFAQDVRYTY